jgi:hypothetical protein
MRVHRPSPRMALAGEADRGGLFSERPATSGLDVKKSCRSWPNRSQLGGLRPLAGRPERAGKRAYKVSARSRYRSKHGRSIPKGQEALGYGGGRDGWSRPLGAKRGRRFAVGRRGQ